MGSKNASSVLCSLPPSITKLILNILSRILTNFYNLEELHLTNAFTELIDSKWYLGDLKDILLTSNMTKLYKLHLEQNEIW